MLTTQTSAAEVSRDLLVVKSNVRHNIGSSWFSSAAPHGQTEVWLVEREGFPGPRWMEPFKFKETDEERGGVLIAFLNGLGITLAGKTLSKICKINILSS